MPKLTVAGFGRKIEALVKSATVEDVTILERRGQQAVIGMDTAQAILSARAAVEAAEREKTRLETALKALLEDASEVVVADQVIFTFAEQQKTVFDSARFRADHPGLFATYSKSQTVRPLLVKSKIVSLLFG